LYAAMPDDVRREFDQAWEALPEEWKNKITQNAWHEYYSPHRYADEFWAYLLMESEELVRHGLASEDDLRLLLDHPAVHALNRKYRLLRVFARYTNGLKASPLPPALDLAVRNEKTEALRV